MIDSVTDIGGGSCEQNEIFTDEEVCAITMQFAKARGAKGFTMDELTELLDDAARIRASNIMLELIISGRRRCDWDGEKLLIEPGDQQSLDSKNKCP